MADPPLSSDQYSTIFTKSNDIGVDANHCLTHKNDELEGSKHVVLCIIGNMVSILPDI